LYPATVFKVNNAGWRCLVFCSEMRYLFDDLHRYLCAPFGGGRKEVIVPVTMRNAITLLCGWVMIAAFFVPPAHAGPNAKILLERKGCLVCHNLNGKGGRKGPPLQHVAGWSDPERMRNYISDPKSVNPGSIMPQVRLKDAELDAIVEYLQSFKDSAKVPENWPGK
jgi:cytochrome c2